MNNKFAEIDVAYTKYAGRGRISQLWTAADPAFKCWTAAEPYAVPPIPSELQRLHAPKAETN